MLNLNAQSVASNTSRGIFYALQLACAMCFIGHGTFGIITKPIWCNYFAVFGIGHDTAYRLMPILGSADIVCGALILFYPVRAVVGWLVVWGFVTALLRPLSGEHFSEFIERGGNFGAPLALLIFSGGASTAKGWFTRLDAGRILDQKTWTRLRYCLTIIGFLLLLGHGGLNLVGKKGLLDQYTALGFSDPAQLARVIGLAEIAAAFVLLIHPFRAFILGVLIWKMASECFYPHYEVFEWVERGGSYGILISLWLITEKKNSFSWFRQQLTSAP